MTVRTLALFTLLALFGLWTAMPLPGRTLFAADMLASFAFQGWQIKVLAQLVANLIVIIGILAFLLVLLRPRHATRARPFIIAGLITLLGFITEDALGVVSTFGDTSPSALKDAGEVVLRTAFFGLLLWAFTTRIQPEKR